MAQTITLGTGLAAATSSLPTTTSDGVAMPVSADRAVIQVWNTAGSGTITISLRLWGYFYGTSKWLPVPIGLGTTVTIGRLFNSTAIAEVTLGTDVLAYSEEVRCLGACNRLFIEVIAVGGTSPQFTVAATLFPKDSTAY